MKLNLLSYLAGIVDGEGYVGIKEINKKTLKTWGRVTPSFIAKICVSMQDKEIVELFHKRYGGSFYIKKTPEGQKNLWSWEISNKQVEKFCKDFLPLLIGKKKQLEHLYLLRKSINEDRKRKVNGFKKPIIPENIIFHRKGLFKKVKLLNI